MLHMFFFIFWEEFILRCHGKVTSNWMASWEIPELNKHWVMFPQFFAYYRGSAIDEWESYIELTGGLIMRWKPIKWRLSDVSSDICFHFLGETIVKKRYRDSKSGPPSCVCWLYKPQGSPSYVNFARTPHLVDTIPPIPGWVEKSRLVAIGSDKNTATQVRVKLGCPTPYKNISWVVHSPVGVLNHASRKKESKLRLGSSPSKQEW